MLDRGVPGCHPVDVIAAPAQDMRLQVAAALVIIDNQDAGRRVGHLAHAGWLRGRTRSIVSINFSDDMSDLDSMPVA